jgi:hypothetical protein
MVEFYCLDGVRPVAVRDSIQYGKWLRSLPYDRQTACYYIIASNEGVMTCFVGNKQWSPSGKSLFVTFVGDKTIEHDCYDDAIVAHREIARNREG